MLIPCVGAIVHDTAGRLLMVRRGHPPATDTWSIPGGRVEAGESDEQAVIREVAEETGLVVTVGALAGTVVRPAPGGEYAISDYRCAVTGGTLAAGDDAAEVRWVGGAELVTLRCAPGLVEALAAWDALPRTASGAGEGADVRA